MSGKIKLPGYDLLIENRVWKRDVEKIKHPMLEGEVPATELLLISRYTVPSDEKVVGAIRRAASNRKGLMLSLDSSKNEIEKSLDMLPPEEIRNILSGNKKSLAHLIVHIPEGGLKAGADYLEMSRSILPTIALDTGKEILAAHGPEAYKFAAQKAGLDRWNVRIRLSSEGSQLSLPRETRMDTLLEHEVKDSNILMVNFHGDFGNYSDVVDKMRLIYRNIREGKLNYLNDQSDKALATKAMLAIRNTAGCIASKSLTAGLLNGGLIKMISEGISEARDQEEKKKHNGYRRHNDCDNN